MGPLTAGWVDGQGYKLLLHALDALKVDNVLVIGQERLHSELVRDMRGRKAGDIGGGGFGGRDVQVWKVPKSGGVVERPPEYRRKSRDARIREYFYGPGGDLSPHSQTMTFGQVSIFRVGSGPRAPSSALPIGMESSRDPLRVSTVAPSVALLNSVLAAGPRVYSHHIHTTFTYCTGTQNTQGP